MKNQLLSGGNKKGRKREKENLRNDFWLQIMENLTQCGKQSLISPMQKEVWEMGDSVPKLRSFQVTSVLLMYFPSDHKVAAMTPGITSTL